jgi:hypothetical protein
LLGSAYNYGQNQDQYAGNKVGQVAGLLSNFTGLGASSTQTAPLYNNRGAGILGGAMLGQYIGKGLNFGGNPASAYNGTWTANGPFDARTYTGQIWD